MKRNSQNPFSVVSLSSSQTMCVKRDKVAKVTANSCGLACLGIVIKHINQRCIKEEMELNIKLSYLSVVFFFSFFPFFFFQIASLPSMLITQGHSQEGGKKTIVFSSALEFTGHPLSVCLLFSLTLCAL